MMPFSRSIGTSRIRPAVVAPGALINFSSSGAISRASVFLGMNRPKLIPFIQSTSNCSTKARADRRWPDAPDSVRAWADGLVAVITPGITGSSSFLISSGLANFKVMVSRPRPGSSAPTTEAWLLAASSGRIV